MPDNKGLDYFRISRPLPTVAGTGATTGLDYFRLGRPLAVVLTGGAVSATGTVSEASLPLTGSSITGTAGQGATGTVSTGNLPLTGSTITGTAGSVVDATGTVSAATLPLTGSSITGIGGKWQDLGQDTVIAATGSASCRSIRQLTIWDGVVWLGHGDIGAAVRPLRGRYWDPGDSSFHTIANQSPGFETDGLNTHFLYGSDLWLPYNDPTNTGDYAVVTSKTTASVEVRTVPNTEHLWSMVEFNGDLYASGGDGSGIGNEATVWKSTDDGATWTIAYQPGITNCHWFTCIFVYDNKLWIEGYNGLSGQHIGNARWSSDGSTWNDAGYFFAAVTPPVMKSVLFNGYALLRPSTVQNNTGKLVRFDGTGQATDITPSIATEVGIQGPIARDICTHNSVAYALGTNRISVSLDGTTWGVIAELPGSETGTSIVADDDWIYVGTQQSHLWRVPNPVGTVEAATLVLSGSTITGTAGQGATGTVSGATLPLSGSTITGSAGTSIDATGIVSTSSLPLTGSSIVATTGQAATGIVAASTLPLSGSTVSGTAGTSATGSVSGATLLLTGSTITAFEITNPGPVTFSVDSVSFLTAAPDSLAIVSGRVDSQEIATGEPDSIQS